MATPWITLNASAVSSEDLTPAEVATLSNMQDSAAVLGRKVAQVVAEFRQAILDGGGQLADGETIPPGFEAHANALARWRWLTAFPNLRSMQTDHRKVAAEKAEDLIKSIASGERKVAAPEAPVTTTATNAPSFATRSRELTRAEQEGT